MADFIQIFIPSVRIQNSCRILILAEDVHVVVHKLKSKYSSNKVFTV